MSYEPDADSLIIWAFLDHNLSKDARAKDAEALNYGCGAPRTLCRCAGLPADVDEALCTPVLF